MYMLCWVLLIQNLSLYAGYEGVSAKYSGKDHAIDGFNIGVG
ncbi:virulence protein [Xenorhabdus sp. TS4]|uniref:Virulence protein n=1 Tax=Xenorhabdus ehlersii TaxID=290111 RepID=A0A2D0IPN6_9GAMM|nr:virulence protein [Xenorhabdus sp. TS4]PHM23784.1 virulence protein [Xenorhabdus ehlersii]